MYEVKQNSGFDSEKNEQFDGWTLVNTSGGIGWGCGHTFRDRANADEACEALNALIAKEARPAKRRYLRFDFDVTDLTEEEIGHLGGYVQAQSEGGNDGEYPSVSCESFVWEDDGE